MSVSFVQGDPKAKRFASTAMAKLPKYTDIKAFLRQLDGQFAFCILDQKQARGGGGGARGLALVDDASLSNTVGGEKGAQVGVKFSEGFILHSASLNFSNFRGVHFYTSPMIPCCK